MTREFPRLRADAFLEQLQRPMGSTRPQDAAHKRAAGRSRYRQSSAARMSWAALPRGRSTRHTTGPRAGRATAES